MAISQDVWLEPTYRETVCLWEPVAGGSNSVGGLLSLLPVRVNFQEHLIGKSVMQTAGLVGHLGQSVTVVLLLVLCLNS